MSEQKKTLKFLFVYPDFLGNEKRKDMKGNYQEGIAIISAVLKQHGYQTALYHLTYAPEEEEFKERIRKENADVVGFSVRTSAVPQVRKMCKWVKEASSAFTVCGGPHATLAPEEMIQMEGMDCVCIGEGEYPELELCNALRDGTDYTHIESLWFKDENGEVIRNPVRPFVQDLNELPMSDFELFDFDNLDASSIATAIVVVSRGCLFSCTYCGNGQMRMVYPSRKGYARVKEPEKAIEYLQTILDKHPYIKYINFRDAILNMYTDWFTDFMNLYKEKIHLPFTCNLRLDNMTEETVKLMKEAGVYMIDVGVESGDQEIRFKYLKRNMSDEQIINSFKWFKKYDIPTLTYNIVGLPYEDLHKALKTIKLNAKINPDRMIPNIFCPYPMTQLAKIAEDAVRDNGGEIRDMGDPKVKVPLIQNTFPEHQVLFVEGYFTKFVKLYKLAYRMPKGIGHVFERMLDGIFVGRFTPRKFLVALSNAGDKTVRWMKRFGRKHLPGIYLKLRNRAYKVDEAKKNAEKGVEDNTKASA